ncbi:MAG: glutathione peroxidase [Bacteroidetes bacterium]|nr:glutathione peroxidase [Bacteroidota bacterium]MBK8657606.1 glutathione peroxidase [Bacteroidota bacterium]
MAEPSIYNLEVKDLSGKPVKLSAYKGKTLLIVNTATKCGLTPQLDALQKVYEKYKGKGLEILGFPSNSFMQEPKEGSDIGQACAINYGVTFKMFEKNAVRGSNAQPLYKLLKKETGYAPIWNFQKYLVDKNGKIVDWFNPWRHPLDAKLTAAIEKCLKTPVES